MNDFKADCTINLHVESRGNPAKQVWVCSITHAKRGRVLLSRKFLGIVSRDEAEMLALRFGIKQALRLLQEKVDVAATFPLESHLKLENSPGRGRTPELKLLREELVSYWGDFRLKRVAKLLPSEAAVLQDNAEKAFQRKRKQEDE